MRHVPRRLLTMPAVVLGSLLTFALSPLLAVVAVVLDLASGWQRHRWVRVLGMGLSFLISEMIALAVGLGLWLATGFGLGVNSGWSQRQHRRMQIWWAGRIVGAAERWLGLSMIVEGFEQVSPGPVIVISRHASFFDGPMLALLVGRLDLRLHFVLKRELTLLPSFDLFGHRLPVCFVDRVTDDGDDGLSAVRDLTTGLGPDGAGVIFPEGTFFTENRQKHVLERVAERDPDHFERAGALRHLLPPRPGGASAMLDGAPDADVALVAHVGFERFLTFRTIIANVPFDRPVQVQAWRIPRITVPEESAARVDWLYDQWDRVDDWIEERESS